MDFDIFRLDSLEPDSRDGIFEEFQRDLLERFSESPEAQARLKDDPGMGFWAAQLMYYGDQYQGSTLPCMTVANLDEIITELFPRKISLSSPDDADDAIPELVAFWKYLKREFRLLNADAILAFLRKVEPDFKRMMNDPSKFGMAKSFFVMGQAAGYDMTNSEGMNAYMAAYNAGLVPQRLAPVLSMPVPHFLGSGERSDPARKKDQKKKRKQVEAARKRNRKRRK